jgi:hypothetical protein
MMARWAADSARGRSAEVNRPKTSQSSGLSPNFYIALTFFLRRACMLGGNKRHHCVLGAPLTLKGRVRTAGRLLGGERPAMTGEEGV